MPSHQALVKSVTYEAERICSYELLDTSGAGFADFAPGSHIELDLPGVGLRRYSLCNAPGEAGVLRIAVLHTQASRGGSAFLHERLRPGDQLTFTGPHNFFALQDDRRPKLLIAGGIGITPIITMMDALDERGETYEMHYCGRNPESTAFLERINATPRTGEVHVHFDHGVIGDGLNIADLMAKQPQDVAVYFCGPPGFMRAIQEACADWAAERVHFEYFGPAPQASPSARAESGAQHEVHLTVSQKVLHVAEGESLLAAIRAAGVECETSCEAGLCGTCLVSYEGGELAHGDYLLTDEERRNSVLLCCAQICNGPVRLKL